MAAADAAAKFLAGASARFAESPSVAALFLAGKACMGANRTAEGKELLGRVRSCVEEHDDRIIRRTERQDFARRAPFLDHEVVSADIDERPSARVGDAK